jgi:hypothetical protein
VVVLRLTTGPSAPQHVTHPEGMQAKNDPASTTDDQLDSQTSVAHKQRIPTALHSKISVFNDKSPATPKPLPISKGRRPTQNLPVV